MNLNKQNLQPDLLGWKNPLCVSTDQHHSSDVCFVLFSSLCAHSVIAFLMLSSFAHCEDTAEWSKQEFYMRATESDLLLVIALAKRFYGTNSIQSEAAGPHMHPKAQSAQNCLQWAANLISFSSFCETNLASVPCCTESASPCTSRSRNCRLGSNLCGNKPQTSLCCYVTR